MMLPSRSSTTRGKPFIVLSTLCALLPACAEMPQPSEEPYRTVSTDVERNQEKAQALNADGVRLLKARKFEEAEATFKEALTADVICGPAHNNLGKAYFHQGKHYLAAWEFQYAAKLLPNHPEPRNNLGLVFETVGKLDNAVEEYGKALTLEPDDPDFLGNLARARIRRGDRAPEVRQLLEDLILKDGRPEWVEWARRTLPTLPRTAKE